MLDYFCIFHKGGAILWTLQVAALKGNPIEMFIKNILLEERQGEKSYTYQLPGSAPYILKWVLNNKLSLVFLAIYQKALSLVYVDELLERSKQLFSNKYYVPDKFDYKHFEKDFRFMLHDCEQRASQQNIVRKQPQVNMQLQNGSSARRYGQDSQMSEGLDSHQDEDGDSSDPFIHDNKTTQYKKHNITINNLDSSNVASSQDEQIKLNGKYKSFDAAKLQKVAGKSMKGRPSKQASIKNAKPALEDQKSSKAQRQWIAGKPSSKSTERLDYSENEPSHDENITSGNKVLTGNDESLMDQEEELLGEQFEQELERQQNQKAQSEEKQSMLYSFFDSIAKNVVGKNKIEKRDLEPALKSMKQKLMERNVAEDIAEKLCESVMTNLLGKNLLAFTGVASEVRKAFQDALTRILTPKKDIDVLYDIKYWEQRRKPYTIVFCGVNGVGKSTNLAKIAYWLKQNDVKVMIAACDTFRSGAIEQLRTHCKRLQIPLFERGYEKEAANVCSEAIKYAEREGVQCLLVDTAGRMQDNEPLMRQLSTLINKNNPDLVLFVGEALVGNDAIDQLTKFSQRLLDLAPQKHIDSLIDGIVLTKFDTIDEKVGAALSMVYTSRSPILFVGVGQGYTDLTKFNVSMVIRALLK